MKRAKSQERTRGIHLPKYDPDKDQRADVWLAASEADRIAAVKAYHRRQRIRLPSLKLHAAIHTIVENQLALGEQVVLEALARLRSQGLTRHEAVHAIGMVLSEEVYEALTNPDAEADLNKPYMDRVKKLTADQWRRSADTPGKSEP